MDKYCTWLDQDTGIQIQITYVEECRSEGSASDQDVIREPSVKMYIIIWKKSVYISSTNVFLVEVEHCDFRIIFEDHTCNNFIADFNWFSSCINFNVFTHFYDFTSSLMSKSNRDQAKWISFEFVCVSTADTASFYFNKDIVIANFRHWEFFDFIMFQCCKHCNMCCFWDYRVSCRSYWSCCAGTFRNPSWGRNAASPGIWAGCSMPSAPGASPQAVLPTPLSFSMPEKRLSPQIR